MEALFRTQFSKPKHVFACPGEEYKIEYGSSLDRYGNIIVKEKGKVNWRDYINSFKDSCDLSVILAKYLNGDTDIINQRKNMFMDLTEMPTNYNDFVNQFNNARDLFDKLPTEVKAKFDNDINKFYCNVGTEDWFTKLKLDKLVSPSITGAIGDVGVQAVQNVGGTSNEPKSE